MQSRDERLGRPRLSGTRQVAASHRAPRTSQVPTSKTVGEEMAIAVESEVEQRIAIAPGEPDVPAFGVAGSMTATPISATMFPSVEKLRTGPSGLVASVALASQVSLNRAMAVRRVVRHRPG